MQSDKELKAETMPMTFWMTRLHGSGKSNLATAMKTALQERGLNCDILDGDVIRQGLTRDLGFTATDRRKTSGAWQRWLAC